MEMNHPLLAASSPSVPSDRPIPGDQIHQPHSSHTEDRKRLPYYNSKAAVATGLSQVSCGVLAIILEAIFCMMFENPYGRNMAAGGKWCGTLFIVNGIIGIVTGKKKRGMVIVYFALSIICIVAALLGLLFPIIHIIMVQGPHEQKMEQEILAVLVLSIVVYILEGLTAIVASSLGCSARVCCGGQPVIQERVVVMQYPGPTQPYDGSHFPAGVPPSYTTAPPIEEKR